MTPRTSSRCRKILSSTYVHGPRPRAPMRAATASFRPSSLGRKRGKDGWPPAQKGRKPIDRWRAAVTTLRSPTGMREPVLPSLAAKGVRGASAARIGLVIRENRISGMAAALPSGWMPSSRPPTAVASTSSGAWCLESGIRPAPAAWSQPVVFAFSERQRSFMGTGGAPEQP